LQSVAISCNQLQRYNMTDTYGEMDEVFCITPSIPSHSNTNPVQPYPLNTYMCSNTDHTTLPSYENVVVDDKPIKPLRLQLNNLVSGNKFKMLEQKRKKSRIYARQYREKSKAAMQESINNYSSLLKQNEKLKKQIRILKKQLNKLIMLCRQQTLTFKNS
jgi:hypothetical protein